MSLSMRQARPFTGSRAQQQRRPCQPPRTARCANAQPAAPADAPQPSRRAMLGAAAGLAPAIATAAQLLAAPAVRADNFAEQLVRKYMRPDDITPQQAAVVFLDARSVLREVSELAATPVDSEARFKARKEWPGYAKWLRDVGPAAPVLVALATGSSGEETLSAEYGGSGATPGLTDAIYIGLGRVLTISGRTIQDGAQLDPSLSQDALKAVQAVLDKLPKELVDEAQSMRVLRASAAGQ